MRCAIARKTRMLFRARRGSLRGFRGWEAFPHTSRIAHTPQSSLRIRIVRSARLAGAPASSAAPTPCAPYISLHIRVVRSAASLWRYPDDILGRILDIAGLAMHAVLRIDDQSITTIVVLHEFI